MNLAEMIAVAREDYLNDVQEPRLWSDEQIARALNDALVDAVRRGRLVVDNSRKVTVRGACAQLDADIIYIKRAAVMGRGTRLRRVSIKDLDDSCPGWQNDVGEPLFYLVDAGSGELRLYPAPPAEVEVSLCVVREPVRMSAGDDVPEIAARFHHAIIHGACARLLVRPDKETMDAQAAAWHESQFAAEFGQPSSATDETWIHENYDAAAMEGVF